MTPDKEKKEKIENGVSFVKEIIAEETKKEEAVQQKAAEQLFWQDYQEWHGGWADYDSHDDLAYKWIAQNYDKWEDLL